VVTRDAGDIGHSNERCVHKPCILDFTPCRYNRFRPHRPRFRYIDMSIDVYWGSGSPFSWRVLLALELKQLPYTSHLLQFSKQEQKSPQMLSMNFRGRVPVLKDGDYVVFESLAVLVYLDRKYPTPAPLFGRSPEEAGVVMRVICEYQAYAEEHVMKIVNAFLLRTPGKIVKPEDLADSMHVVANEARSIEARLASADWVV